jgi:electron transfer flavoprotein alpha subunit
MSLISVNKGRCNGCGDCVELCAYGAITVVNGKAVIDPNLCTLCRACVKGCSSEAISLERLDRKVDLSTYRGIWVVVEHFGGELKETGFQLISKANELARASRDRVTALLIGDAKPDVARVRRAFAEYGVKSVHAIWNAQYTRFLTEDAAEAISEKIRAGMPRIVLFLGTIWGRSIAPQVAMRVKTGLTADCTELAMDKARGLLQIRPTYGGKVLATIETPYSCPQMASVRPNVFIEEKKPVPAAEVTVEVVEAGGRSSIADSGVKKVLDIIQGDGEFETPLEEAKKVFCAGLGVGSREGYAAVEEFAKSCGAAIAATRGVVDEGWADASRQIGQTGITIRPELYVGFGVSGAIHHIIGMRNSRTIVAINRDARAPIFKVADFCVVADLFEVLEKMKVRVAAAR